MSLAQRILIVSQTFPPYNGIGGRRWAKFAKYLDKNGHDIQVVCADLPVRKESPWTNDVKGLTRHTYTHYFPRVVEQFPVNAVEKVAYRLKLASLKRKSRGTPFDRALLDEDSFKRVFFERMKAFSPQTLIVTGAPFYLLNYALDYRHQFPETKFIADFRDPWTWGKSYGYTELSEKRLNYEKKLEKKVVASYDVVLSPWPSIVEKLKSIYPDNSFRFKLLEHGFDQEDLPLTNNKLDKSQTDLIFGGTIYHGMESLLRKIISASDTEFRFSIYSNDLEKLEPVKADVLLNQQVPSSIFFTNVSASKAVLMLVPEHMKDGIPSKLFEYASLGTPIIALGHRGSLSAFIELHKFGIFLDRVEEIPKTIKQVQQLNRDEEVLVNYNFENLTKKLESFLKKE